MKILLINMSTKIHGWMGKKEYGRASALLSLVRSKKQEETQRKEKEGSKRKKQQKAQ